MLADGQGWQFFGLLVYSYYTEFYCCEIGSGCKQKWVTIGPNGALWLEPFLSSSADILLHRSQSGRARN